MSNAESLVVITGIHTLCLVWSRFITGIFPLCLIVALCVMARRLTGEKLRKVLLFESMY